MRWMVVVVMFALAAPAAAGPRKILVLPIEGNADVATRARLTTEVARLARSLDGQVSTGSASFGDAALAVGCDPRAAGCRDEVMATLAVDELVWGTASKDGNQIRLVVRRAARGAAPRETSTVVPAGEPGERLGAALAPLFAPAAGAPAAATPASPGPPPPTVGASEPASTAPQELPAAAGQPAPAVAAPALALADHRRDRNVGIALVSAAGVSLAVGFALWASFSSLQSSIDDHPTRTPADFRDLTALEDRASTRAIAGDVLVAAGILVGGLGAYYLYRDHKRHGIAIAPAPIAGGGGLTITWQGGLP